MKQKKWIENLKRQMQEANTKAKFSIFALIEIALAIFVIILLGSITVRILFPEDLAWQLRVEVIEDIFILLYFYWFSVRQGWAKGAINLILIIPAIILVGDIALLILYVTS